jgi:hypothetical protein
MTIQSPTHIAIKTDSHPVLCENLERFLHNSPSVRGIAFMGDKLYTSPEFKDILALLAHWQIEVFFNGLCPLSDSAVNELVNNGWVRRIYYSGEISPELQETIDKISTTKQNINSEFPEFVHIPPPEFNLEKIHLDPDAEFHSFFDLAREVNTMPCLKLITFPLIDYDGTFIGCGDYRLPKDANAFNDGLDAALNSRAVKQVICMMKKCKPDHRSPCVRCPGFISLMFEEKKLDLIKGEFI